MAVPSSANTAAAIRHDRNGELRPPPALPESLLRSPLRSSPVAKWLAQACSPRKCVLSRFLSLRNSPSAAFWCTKLSKSTALLAPCLYTPRSQQNFGVDG